VPFLVRTYLFAYIRFTKTIAVAWKVHTMFAKAIAAVEACFIGLWLGVLTRERLNAVDEEFYTSSKLTENAGEPDYHSKEYNRRGLWDFEKRVLADYFSGCKRLLVIAAGGGREVLALQRLEYEVDGFESHPSLVAAANELLRAEGYDSVVRPVPRDKGPNTGITYDGIIIGWGAYMLVQGRKRRIALLQQLRAQTQAQCPLLLSFFKQPKRFDISNTICISVANMIRRVLRQEPAECGDWLSPFYLHYLTRDEVTSELSEGGFRLVHYSTKGYGHAVGIAA
jgi:hypothetical protein